MTVPVGLAAKRAEESMIALGAASGAPTVHAEGGAPRSRPTNLGTEAPRAPERFVHAIQTRTSAGPSQSLFSDFALPSRATASVTRRL